MDRSGKLWWALLKECAMSRHALSFEATLKRKLAYFSLRMD